MNYFHTLGDLEINKESLCMADSAIKHTIIINKKIFFKANHNVGSKSQYNIRFCKLD